MEEKKAVKTEAAETKPAKKFDIRTVVDWPSLIATLISLAVAAALTYLTVWLEYTWMRPSDTHTYVGMLIFFLRNNDGAYKELFYSIIVCGFVVWTALCLAASYGIRRAVAAIQKKVDAKKAAKASR